MSESINKQTPFFKILLKILAQSIIRFGTTYFQILRHPFLFFDNVNPNDAKFVFRSIEFALYSFVLNQILIFIGMLPNEYMHLTIMKQFFMLFGVCMVGSIWHLTLKHIGKSSIYLSGTMSAILYHIGFFSPIFILSLVLLNYSSYLPVLQKIAIFIEIEFGASLGVLMFIFIMIPLIILSLYVLCRWVSIIHSVRKIVAFLTLMILEIPYELFIKKWIMMLYSDVIVNLIRQWSHIMIK